MAKLEDKAIQLKLVFGVEDGDKIRKKSIVVKDINPELSDDDLYKFAKDMVALQKLKVLEINKVQNEHVVEAMEI